MSGAAEPRTQPLDRWPLERVRCATLAYRAAKGIHGIERIAAADATAAWVEQGGTDEEARQHLYAALRTVQERFPAWFDASARRLEALRSEHFRPLGAPFPKDFDALPTLDQLLAAGVAVEPPAGDR